MQKRSNRASRAAEECCGWPVEEEGSLDTLLENAFQQRLVGGVETQQSKRIASIPKLPKLPSRENKENQSSRNIKKEIQAPKTEKVLTARVKNRPEERAIRGREIHFENKSKKRFKDHFVDIFTEMRTSKASYSLRHIDQVGKQACRSKNIGLLMKLLGR